MKLTFSRTFGVLDLFFKNRLNNNRSSVLFSTANVLILSAIAYLFFTQLTQLNSSYSVDQFFPKDHSLLLHNKEIRQTFHLENKSAIFVVITDHSKNLKNFSLWLKPAKMFWLRDLTQQLSQIENVQSTKSLATLEGVGQDGDTLSVGPLYDEKNVSMWNAITNNNYFAKSQFLSKDGLSNLLVIEPKALSPQQLTVLIGKIDQHIKSSLQHSASLTKNLSYSLGGAPVLQSRFADKLNTDLKQFSIIGFILFVAVFVFLFKGYSSLFVTIFSILIGEVVVLGALALFSIPFSVLMSSLPIIVSIAMISIHIHTLHRWSEVWPVLHTCSDRWLHSFRVLKEMFLPNLLGSLTTAIGFITLIEMNSPLIQQYGMSVALAVMAGFLISQWTLSVLMVWTRPELRTWFHAKSVWGLSLLKNSSYFFVGILAVSVFLGLMGKKLQYSSRLFDDLPAQDVSRQTTDYIDNQFGGVIPYEMVLKHDKSKDFKWTSVYPVKQLQKMLVEIRQLENVGSVISLTDFLQIETKHKKNKYSDHRVLQGAIDETLFFYSMSEKNPIQQFLSSSGDLRIALRMHDQDTDKVNSTRDKTKQIVHKYFPNVHIREGGLAVVAHALNQEISRDLVLGFWHSILFICVLLLFVFRSLRWALVACLPNLIPPAVLLGLLVIFKTPLKPGVAIVFSIALGLAFNNTVYMLSRLRSQIKSNKPRYLPLKQMLLQEGNPCLFESLVMVFGFVVFLSSQFQMTKIFGFYMLVSIIAGAIGDIVFMPTMLKLFPEILTARFNFQKSFPFQFKTSFSQRLKFAGFALVLLIVGVAWAAHARADERAVGILKNVRMNMDFKDQSSLVDLKIIEADGEIKGRNLKMQVLRDKKFYVIGKILQPSDVKGTQFLAEMDGKNQKQWVYLPSSKQVRRIVGGANQLGFLGSELKAEDLNPTDFKRGNWNQKKIDDHFDKNLSIVKEEGGWLKLQLKNDSINKKPSSFDLVQFTVSQKDASKPELLLRSDYYLKGKLQKTVSFEKYQKIGNTWFPHRIHVENKIKNRKTDVVFAQVQINQKLKPSDFSVNQLKK